MSPPSPPPLRPEEETVIAFSHLLDEADLPPDARASVPIPAPSTDEVVTRGIDDLSARIWDWAEQHPGLSDALSNCIAELDPDTGGGEEEGGVAGMDLSDVSPSGGKSGADPSGMDTSGAGPVERDVGPPEPTRGRRGRSLGRRRTGGPPGMTGDQPGSAQDAAVSELEDTEGLYVLRNAVNLARDLARTMRDRPA